MLYSIDRDRERERAHTIHIVFSDMIDYFMTHIIFTPLRTKVFNERFLCEVRLRVVVVIVRTLDKA